MQFSPLPVGIGRIENASLARVLRAPNNSLPGFMVSNLKAMGLKQSCCSLQLLARATMCRAWMRAPAITTVAEIEAALERTDDKLLVEPNPVWTSTSIVRAMHTTYMDIHSLNHPRIIEASYAKHLQSIIYQVLLQQAGSAQLQRCVTSRIATMSGQDVTNESVVRDLFASIVDTCVCASRMFSLTACSAYLRSVTNAWVTSSRFQLVPEQCAFCGAESGDSIRHYAECPCIGEMLERHWPGLQDTEYVHCGLLPFINYPPPRVQLQEARVVLLVCLHDAIHASVTGYRQGRLRKPGWHSLHARIKMFARNYCGPRAMNILVAGIRAEGFRMEP